MTKNTWTQADAGCYIDGARGIYMVDRIVEIAEDHGFKVEGCDDDHSHTAGDGSYTSWAACEFADEIADEATDHMNEAAAVDGFYWGFNDGDWGLWRCREMLW